MRDDASLYPEQSITAALGSLQCSGLMQEQAKPRKGSTLRGDERHRAATAPLGAAKTR